MRRLETYREKKFTNFDVNEQDNTTDWVDVRSSKWLTLYVIGTGNAHNNHIIELETSPDKTDVGKPDSANNIIGDGYKTIDCTGLSYVRCKCKTPQGAQSLVNIWIVPFREK